MTPAISATGLTRKYYDQVALDDVHLTIGARTITGLLGRNGAGKTTLLRILAGQEFPSSGSVQVFGSAPAENQNVLRRLVLVREDQAYPDFEGYPNFKVSHALRAASFCYPDWDAHLASSLLEDFGLRAGKAIKSLSRGQRSALGITIGLAARAEVTLFDEPYAGLDAVARQIFYDRLLADYADFPRTVLLSTHLIDEAAALFFVTGVQRVGRWLPFGLALGATRRSFYAGTALLGVSMSLVSGLVIAGLQAIERATGGWGLSITFFRLPYLLNGPWYATWLTSFVGLSALFVYGMWYGIVNRRWGTLGLLAFIAVQALVALAVTFAYTRSSGGPLLLRPADGHPATLSALELTGVIAALTVVCLAGGHATIRRVTV